MKKLLESSLVKKRLKLISIISVMLLIIVFIPFTFANEEPVKKVEIYSEKSDFRNGEAGSWKIEKSAKWVGKGEAEVTFDVFTEVKMEKEYNDIIFVLDTSNSMEGKRLIKLKADAEDLINNVFKKDGNKVALITFNDDAQILSDFTDDKDYVIERLREIGVNGGTNYYQAFERIKNVLQSYTYNENRNCVVLFLTDGYANVDIPNERMGYLQLKSQYPFVQVNAVQYEMGDSVLGPTKVVSDNQFIASMETLYNSLYDASVIKMSYGIFTIDDYIDTDNFYVSKEADIEVTKGKFTFDAEEQKITWDLSSMASGMRTDESLDEYVRMKIRLNLQDSLMSKEGVYNTNTHEVIKSTIDNDVENIDSELTPALRSSYNVSYDVNLPEGAELVGDAPSDKTYLVYDTVEIAEGVKSNEYQFAGWEIMTENVERINNDYFIMPEADVQLKAKWKKLNICKTMDGTLHSVERLYDTIKGSKAFDDSRLTYDTDWSSNAISKTYSGVYEMKATSGDEFPIYFYRGTNADTKNNLIYAGYCWKIVRTTETGGVKIVYNGVPSSEGFCNNTGAGSAVGRSAFNSSASSIVHVGYMYGDTLMIPGSKDMRWYRILGKTLRNDNTVANTEYYYADSVTYDPDTGLYTLGEGAASHLWESDFGSLSGYYTCVSTTNEGCAKVRYVDHINSQTSAKQAYIEFENGETYVSWYDYYELHKWKFSNQVTWNGNSYDLVLDDVIEINPFDYVTNVNQARTNISNAHHYSCLAEGTNCNYITYVYFSGQDSLYRTYNEIYSVSFTNGTTIESLYDNLINTENKNPSNIKTAVDKWYENTILDTEFEAMLEDTVWCNNRLVKYKNGWDTNGNSANFLYFKETYVHYRDPEVTCSRMQDRFTVSEDVGNGKLSYPVGLLTADETTLGGSGSFYCHSSDSYLNAGIEWWTMTPRGYNENYAYNYTVDDEGELGTSYNVVRNSFYVRPALSLNYDVFVVGGDGDLYNPYQIDDSRPSYTINIETENVVADKPLAKEKAKVTLSTTVEGYMVSSFKLDGELIQGNTFEMPARNVVVSEVEIVEIPKIEEEIVESSSHSPYSNNASEEFEKTYEGAKSLNVVLEYQTEDANYDYITISSNSGYNKKFGGSKTAIATENITIEGNHIKITFITDASINQYYGFKATIRPQY